MQRLKNIDLKFLLIVGVILLVAFTAAWITIVVFRIILPAVAESTFWDELSGPTVATLVILGIKWLLYREMVFHLLITADIPGTENAQIWILRRRAGQGLILLPRLQREALISQPVTLVRNVFWWGVYGVDRCALYVRFGEGDTSSHVVEFPRGLYHAHAIVRVRLSELTAPRLVITGAHIE